MKQDKMLIVHTKYRFKNKSIKKGIVQRDHLSSK